MVLPPLELFSLRKELPCCRAALSVFRGELQAFERVQEKPVHKLPLSVSRPVVSVATTSKYRWATMHLLDTSYDASSGYKWNGPMLHPRHRLLECKPTPAVTFCLPGFTGYEHNDTILKEQADVAQLVEQLIRNQQVVSSSLTVGSSLPHIPDSSQRTTSAPTSTGYS